MAYPLDQMRYQMMRLRTSRKRPLSSLTIFSNRREFPFLRHSVLFSANLHPSTLHAKNDNGENEQEADGSVSGDDDNEESSIKAVVDAAVEKLKKKFMKRITRLEDIVSRQEVELYRLRQKASELAEVSEAFTNLLKLLREAGLDAETLSTKRSGNLSDEDRDPTKSGRSIASSSTKSKDLSTPGKVVESYDEEIIFGTAPSSVSDAADAAGAAILAAMLGGKQRMLVDVRDAELSTDPETLVQFIELAILPIAAGLEGLKSTRNRVKIVFPKVSQLLEYRRTMALAAPEVVALSTLGFDPVEDRDKLVVIVAPEPDDEEGINTIRELLQPSSGEREPIQQPVVVLNYHMIPFQGLDMDFETAYHLRLLTVQYMSDKVAEGFLKENERENNPLDDTAVDDAVFSGEPRELEIVGDESVDESDEILDEAALESAMKHAHELGMHQGTTRAMVIRAYPRPWHVFVDLSPDTDADYEVAATFDEEPSLEQINFSIVECLEGSEIEDEIVAQQMQQALEEGQLNKVSDMISDALGRYDDGEDDDTSDDSDNDFDMFEEDSV
jgi:hypothetical protein